MTAFPSRRRDPTRSACTPIGRTGRALDCSRARHRSTPRHDGSCELLIVGLPRHHDRLLIRRGRRHAAVPGVKQRVGIGELGTGRPIASRPEFGLPRGCMPQRRSRVPRKRSHSPPIVVRGGYASAALSSTRSCERHRARAAGSPIPITGRARHRIHPGAIRTRRRSTPGQWSAGHPFESAQDSGMTARVPAAIHTVVADTHTELAPLTQKLA